jgi:hypothetical protein
LRAADSSAPNLAQRRDGGIPKITLHGGTHLGKWCHPHVGPVVDPWKQPNQAVVNNLPLNAMNTVSRCAIDVPKAIVAWWTYSGEVQGECVSLACYSAQGDNSNVCHVSQGLIQSHITGRLIPVVISEVGFHGELV